MISTALKLMLLCVLMEQVTSWPPSREPESVYYAPGRRGHRPFQCCRACGDDYALTVDRCMYDPYHNKSKIYDPSDNTIFPNKLSSFHGEKFDVFMEVSRSCCAFCGTNKKEFEYSAEKGECVRLKEQVSTFITVHEQYCNLCLFITGDTLINNNHETILPYDLKKCNSFYSDKELCIIFLQNYYDEIIKNGLSSTPSKLCHQFGYCQSKGADYTGLLQEALAKLRSGEAKVIQNGAP